MSISENSAEYSYIDKYCNNVSFKKALSKNTVLAYKSDLKIFYEWLKVNHYTFSSADRVIINNYLASRLDNGISVSTIQRIISCIKSFFYFFMKIG